MSKALYRKYRSKRLSEIVGQEQVTTLLERALKTQQIAHAYLFTGPRGTGKTSIARILAHEITGLEYRDEADHLDIIEIDAASNNGVEDVRELREKAMVAPSQADKKIYIIDEVHMLSKAAFNALLKILEEPPTHVVFILATTDFDKVPITIVSRTQRFHFRLIDESKVVKHLQHIATEEKITIETAALELIAQRGGGSFRDSISLLDQLRSASTETITVTTVEEALGLARSDEIETLVQALLSLDTFRIISCIQAIERRGVGAATVASQLSLAIRRHIATSPHLVLYLEGLSTIARSNHPEVSLLVTLLAHATPQPPTAPAPMAAPSPPPPPAPAPTPVKAPATPVRRSTPATKPSAPPPPDTTVKASEAAAPNTAPTIPFDSERFNWQVILDYATEHKETFIGVHSLLAKCTPELKGERLVLYTGNKFNKNKLDSAKNRVIIGKIFAETGIGDVEIETIATPVPPKNEHAAKIAAMMGGGEEIDV